MGLRHAIALAASRAVAMVPSAVATDAGVVVGVEEGFVYDRYLSHWRALINYLVA